MYGSLFLKYLYFCAIHFLFFQTSIDVGKRPREKEQEIVQEPKKENKIFFALRPNYTKVNIASYFIWGNFQPRGNIQVTLLARRNKERKRERERDVISSINRPMFL